MHPLATRSCSTHAKRCASKRYYEQLALGGSSRACPKTAAWNWIYRIYSIPGVDSAREARP